MRALGFILSGWSGTTGSRDGDRVELPTYDTLLGDHRSTSDPASGEGRKVGVNASARASWKERKSQPVLYLSLVALGFLLARYGLASRKAADGLEYPSKVDVWSEFGDTGGESRVGTRPTNSLHPCKRTLLLPWSSFSSGMGSLVTASMQGMLFAKKHDYEFLVSREVNWYGTFLDHFEPADHTRCRVTEEMYASAGRDQLHTLTSEAYRGPEPARDVQTSDSAMLAGYDAIVINQWVRNITYGDISELDSLPPSSAYAPLPGSDTVPTLFRKRFYQYSAVSAEQFRMNPKVCALRDKYKGDLGLEGTAEKPTIGVHYRGGDKLADECRPSAQLSCGNITVHCMAARDALRQFAPNYPTFDMRSGKARLLLMSAEPDAPQLFRNEPLCAEFFTVETFPHGGTDKSFVQSDFRALPETDRIEDTHRLLAEIDILANWVDASVVSANSNTGRMVMTRGGPVRVIDEPRVRSVDIPWHPFQFPPFAGHCDGTRLCYPP